ncbi:hypothetical protein HDU77_004121 [Chytriomyces hyalinus]|nr:hypothetical protein HDU77_004121 [Chytriomyces hyalinus]
MVFIPRSGNAVAPRKEVLTFFADQKQASLFLQAFAVIQARDSKDPKSYAQVSAIHGLPNLEYDGFPMKKPNGGYCVHGAALFPTWHRPYIALIEMLIIEAAVEIAKRYTKDTQAWLQAAQTIRFPYWDWATKENLAAGVPDIFVVETVSVQMAPEGKPATIRNPLASYAIPAEFRASFPNELGPLKNFKNTVRFPMSKDADAKSNVASLKEAMKKLSPQLRSMVRVLFDGSVTDWADFSNHSMDFGNKKRVGNYHSVEYVHDQVHGTISGNGGHMGYPEVASYDPIFYFHHCNIDRLLALYQQIYGLYADSKIVGEGLAPFKDSADPKSVWSSAEVFDTKIMNYTYPEMQFKGRDLQQKMLALYGATTAAAPVAAAPAVPIKTRGIEPAVAAHDAPVVTERGLFGVQKAEGASSGDFSINTELKKLEKGFSSFFTSTMSAVNNLTGSAAGASAAVPAAAEPQHAPPVANPAGSPPANHPTSPPPAGGASSTAPDAESSVYAHFSVKKNSINGPFTIQYYVHDQYAAESFIFARVKKETCSNCMDLDDLTLGGACSLTEAFKKAGILQDSAKWKGAVKVRVVDWENKAVPVSRLGGFKVLLRGAVVKTAGAGWEGVNGVEQRRRWYDDPFDLDDD